jgi:hypothetical protein
MAVATGIILTAGTITFANEWYQTKQVNWRVPVATLLIAAIFDGLARLDDHAATGLAIIAFIGAVTTEFNGQSAAGTIASIFSQPKPAKKG